jgi:short-subunit dehydrogenase
LDYSGKVVVITGASSGIGEQSAEEFAKLHANIVLISRNEENLRKVATKLSKYKTTVFVYACDISRKNQVDIMGKTIIEKFGTIDVLVNNAGFAIHNTVNETKIEEMESQMMTNFFGMMYCTKIFLPKMLEQKAGHIVNVASVAGSIGIPGMASYCASKFAILGFSESLFHELQGTGVRITVVSPIMVKTNFFNHESFSNMTRYSSVAINSKTVADAIVKAASSHRLEIIVPQFVRFVVWIKQTLPYLVNPIIGGVFRKSIKSKIN